MREIARQVGVDAAMISRYFGCKEDLFAEALISGGEEGRTWMDGPREDFGQRLAHQLVYEPQNDEKLCGVMMMLRANGSAKACEVVRRVIADEYMTPFEAWLGGENAKARALLASSIMMGATLCLSLTGPPDDPEEKRLMCERLAEALQACVDG